MKMFRKTRRSGAGLILIFLSLSGSGCASLSNGKIPSKGDTIPEILFAPCTISDSVPQNNRELLNAWAEARVCAEKGNEDKAELRRLIVEER